MEDKLRCGYYHNFSCPYKIVVPRDVNWTLGQDFKVGSRWNGIMDPYPIAQTKQDC